MAGSDGLAVVRKTVERFLGESFGAVRVLPDGGFFVPRDGMGVWIKISALGPEQTVVIVWTVSNVGVTLTPELTRYLAVEGGNLTFGQFELHEQPMGVLISHGLIGEYLSREELEVAVDEVHADSRRYGPTIKTKFGGLLASEAASAASQPGPSELVNVLSDAPGLIGSAAPPPRAEESGRRRQSVVQGVFGLVGTGSGVLASIAAYRRTSSWFLVAFVFLLASYLIGRGLGDVVTDPNKVRRAFYFVIPAAVATGVLALVYGLWERWWLAVLLGSVGWLLGGVAANLLFPSVAAEELVDTHSRARKWFVPWR